MRKEDATVILHKVRANLKALDECDGPHDFGPPIPRDKTKVFQDRVCTKCGGRVEPHIARWYIKGLEHGRRG
jgi:hypothetical protein